MHNRTRTLRRFYRPVASLVSPYVKYLLFAFNVVFWLLGAAVIAATTWALVTKYVERSKIVSSAFDYVFDITLLLLIAAILIFVITTCGCVGALRENIILLRIFTYSLAAIFLVLLIGGIVAFALRSRLKSSLKADLSVKLIRNYYDDPDLRDQIDNTQTNLQCCGFSDDGYMDWLQNERHECPLEELNTAAYPECAVPPSCCLASKRGSGFEFNALCGSRMLGHSPREASTKIYTRGCIDSVYEYLSYNILTIAGVVLGVSFVLLLGSALGAALTNQIIDQRDRWISQHSPQQQPRYIYATDSV